MPDERDFFDVAIEPNGERYTLRIALSRGVHAQLIPAEERPNDTFPLEFGGDRISLETIRRGIESQPLTVRLDGSSDTIQDVLPNNLSIETLREYGTNLYTELFSAEEKHEIRGICSAIRDGDRKPTVIRINDGRARQENLPRVPWECLNQPDSPIPFALNENINIVRWLRSNGNVPAPNSVIKNNPIRVLVAMATPEDHPSLDIDGELRGILDNQGQRQPVIVEPLYAATLNSLHSEISTPRNGIERYDIVHFIGHSDVDENNNGYILLNSFGADGLSEQEAERISANDLATMFAGKTPLAVVLNSCKSAENDRENVYSGLAQTLINLGVPYVIAMQYSIADKAASVFSEGFYSALRDQLDIPTAVVKGRSNIKHLDEEFLRTSYITPVLFTSENPPDFFIDSAPDSTATPTVVEDDVIEDSSQANIENSTLLNILKTALEESLGKLLVAIGLMVMSWVGATFANVGQLIKSLLGLLSIVCFILIAFILGKHSQPITPLSKTAKNVIDQAPQSHADSSTNASLDTNDRPSIRLEILKNFIGAKTRWILLILVLAALFVSSLTFLSLNGSPKTLTVVSDRVASEFPVKSLESPTRPSSGGVVSTEPQASLPPPSSAAPPSLGPATKVMPSPSSPAPLGQVAPAPSSPASTQLRNRKLVFVREDFDPLNIPDNVCWAGDSLTSRQMPYTEGSTICSPLLHQNASTKELYVHICTKNGNSYDWKRSLITQCQE